MDPLRQRVNRPVRIQEARHMRQFYFEARILETDETALLDNENLTFRYGSEGVAEIYHESLPSQNLIEVPNDFFQRLFQIAEMQ
jgi:hypothetical protein